VQYVIRKAIIETGRRNDSELRENLSDLIIKRIQNSDNDLRRIVLNEAIETIPKLTSNALKIVTLCFVLRYVKQESKNIKELIKFLNDTKSFLDFHESEAEFQHIAYSGCGQPDLVSGWNYFKSLPVTYPKIFPILLETESIKKFNVPINTL